MHFMLLVAGALLPGELAVAVTPLLDAPTLQRRLARATVIEQRTDSITGVAHLDWLAEKLFRQAAPVATAPYAYAHLTGQPSASSIWHADPVHIEVARDHLIVQELGSDAPTAAESKQLIATANELMLDAGCELIALDQCWFLSCMHNWQIDTHPLSSAIGTAVELPSGGDAHVWNRLHNEIQIAWHTDRVNAEREANGVRTINAVWLHGGGRWKPLTATNFSQVQADAPAWQGAARAAGARSSPLNAPVSDGALMIVDSPAAAKQRQDWTAWLQAMAATDQLLNGHSADSIDLILCGDSSRTFESNPFDRYKLWRHRTLAQALTE